MTQLRRERRTDGAAARLSEPASCGRATVGSATAQESNRALLIDFIRALAREAARHDLEAQRQTD